MHFHTIICMLICVYMRLYTCIYTYIGVFWLAFAFYPTSDDAGMGRILA